MSVVADSSILKKRPELVKRASNTRNFKTMVMNEGPKLLEIKSIPNKIYVKTRHDFVQQLCSNKIGSYQSDHNFKDMGSTGLTSGEQTQWLGRQLRKHTSTITHQNNFSSILDTLKR